MRSSVPVNAPVTLKISASNTSVTVEANGGDLVENDSTFHTDVDRHLFVKVPLESASSPLTSLVTLTSPGVAADSNGLMHGLGDHAENAISLDGQPGNRPVQQSLLKPGTLGRRAIDGSDLRRATRRIWR